MKTKVKYIFLINCLLVLTTVTGFTLSLDSIKNSIELGAYSTEENNYQSFSFDYYLGQTLDINFKINSKVNSPYENYSFSSLGLDDSVLINGINVQKTWKYIRFNIDYSYLKSKSGSNSASEDINLALSDINYAEKDYQYLLINKGSAFESEISAHQLYIDFVITPVRINIFENFNILPLINFGFYNLDGTIDIKSASSNNTYTDQVDGFDRVVNASGSGWFGSGVPYSGFGAEISYALELFAKYNSKIIFSFNFNSAKWDGKSDDWGLDVGGSVDIDIDYKYSDFILSCEVELSEILLVFFGIKYNKINTESDISYNIAKSSSEDTQDISKIVDADNSAISIFTGIKF